MLSIVNKNLSKRVREMKQKHHKKLLSLARAQGVLDARKAPKPIDNFVINLSSVQFSTSELELLNKGLNFAITPKAAPLADIINNIESAIQYSDLQSKSSIRHNIKKCLLHTASKQNYANHTNSSEWCTIQKLKKHDVVYTRADKGNAVVIMDKSDYDSRVLNMLQSGPYEEYKFKNGKSKDPLNSMIEEANSTRQKIARLVGDDRLERKLHVSNAKVASLYCLPKVHKNPVAMRPISSNINTPTEKMAAWLVKEMKKYPITHGNSVINSVDFVKQVKDLELRRGEVLISFDVSSLFPNVPANEAIQSLCTHLERNKVPPNEIEAYLTIAKLCMNQNFLAFRNKFYRQVFGLSMGSKLSPILAEVFMSDFEASLKKEKLFPRVWKRYVDDVFAVVKERYLPQTLQFLNSRHNTIKFTMEREVEGKLPFLDLLVTRKENNTLKFSIYRKPTSTDRYITCDSNHFGAQKKAAFHTMVHRLINIPMEEEDFEIEKLHIHKTAELNGYDANFVNHIIRKHERKKHRSIATTFQPEKKVLKRVSLPFYPKITNAIKNKLRRHDIHVVYKSGYTLRELLCNLKDRIPFGDLSGIYEICCENCSSVYIGQSRRKFKTRLKEHKSAVENKKINESSVATHAIHLQHNINWDSAKLIKHVRKTTDLNAWESMFITTATQPLMNEDDAPIISPLFKLITLNI